MLQLLLVLCHGGATRFSLGGSVCASAPAPTLGRHSSSVAANHRRSSVASSSVHVRAASAYDVAQLNFPTRCAVP